MNRGNEFQVHVLNTDILKDHIRVIVNLTKGITL